MTSVLPNPVASPQFFLVTQDDRAGSSYLWHSLQETSLSWATTTSLVSADPPLPSSAGAPQGPPLEHSFLGDLTAVLGAI